MSTPRQANTLYMPDALALDPNYFEIQERYRKYVAKILITEGTIANRVQRLAREIHDTYSKLGGNVVLVSLLNGAVRFSEKLYLELAVKPDQEKPVRYFQEFLKASSYSNMQSTGTVAVNPMSSWLRKSAANSHILLVDEMLDSGRTLQTISTEFRKIGATSIKVAVLLVKRDVEHVGLVADFVGFEVDNHFLVGCGLDVNQCFRDLPHVCIVDEQAVQELLTQ